MEKKPKTHSDNSELLLAVSGIWAICLLAGFLYFRSEDLGNFKALPGNLTEGQIFGFNGFFESVSGILVAAMIFAGWFGLGRFLSGIIEKKFAGKNVLNTTAPSLDFALSCAAGAGIWSFIWFFLGLFGAYNKIFSVILLIIGLALCMWNFIGRSKSQKHPDKKTDIFGNAAFGLILLLCFAALISAIAPPVAKDTLLYHFSVPQHFIGQGSNAVIEGNIASYLALGTEMHVVWAMLLGSIHSVRVGEIAAGTTVFAFVPILLFTVYGWSRELGSGKTLSILSALLIASIPTGYHIASSGYIDLALALYITLAVYCVARWLQKTEDRWLIYIAIFSGSALAVKLTAAFAIVSIGLVILLQIRKMQGEGSTRITSTTKKVFAMLAGIGVIASPWYLRNFAVTGSPIFPFYMNIWNGTAVGWDVKRSTLFQIINSNYGGTPKSVTDYLVSPFAVSLKAQPELPEFFDGVLGVAFIFGIPLIIWAWRRSLIKTELKYALMVSGMLFIFWLFTSQQLRYLLPVFPVLSVSICFAVNALAGTQKYVKRGFGVILLVISVVNAGVTLAWFARKAPLQVVLGGEARDAYLARNIDYYPYYQLINTRIPSDSKIWLINMRRDTYHIKKPYFSDYMFEDWTLKRMVEASETLFRTTG